MGGTEFDKINMRCFNQIFLPPSFVFYYSRENRCLAFSIVSTSRIYCKVQIQILLCFSESSDAMPRIRIYLSLVFSLLLHVIMVF